MSDKVVMAQTSLKLKVYEYLNNNQIERKTLSLSSINNFLDDQIVILIALDHTCMCVCVCVRMSFPGPTLIE